MTTVKEGAIEFILHCKHEKKLSDKTQRCYEIDLTQFAQFISINNYSTCIADVDKTILRNYLQNLSTFKHKTIKRKIATLKAFFNYLEFEDKIIFNPFRKVRFQMKEPKRLPTVMTTLEVKKMFNAVYSKRTLSPKEFSYRDFETMRNIAVIELLFATGIRVSELSNLDQRNIDLQEGFIKVIGKGNKERTIQICNKEIISILNHYSKLSCGFRGNSTTSFFVNRLGAQLSEQSVRSIVKDVSKQAILNKHITPHVFRHSVATLLLEQDVDIKYIQVILGHSSIMTTQIYTHVNSEKQKAILTDKHPRGNFSMLAT